MFANHCFSSLKKTTDLGRSLCDRMKYNFLEDDTTDEARPDTGFQMGSACSRWQNVARHAHEVEKAVISALLIQALHSLELLLSTSVDPEGLASP